MTGWAFDRGRGAGDRGAHDQPSLRWLFHCHDAAKIAMFVGPPRLAGLCDRSFRLSFCPFCRSISRTRLQTSTKHGRHGQDLTL